MIMPTMIWSNARSPEGLRISVTVSVTLGE